MVERTLQLNSVFHCLSNATRRDILHRIAKKELSVGQVARNYNLTFAAVSKHIKVLEKSGLVVKHKRGKEHIIRAVPQELKAMENYLRFYVKLWEQKFDRLEEVLEIEKLQILQTYNIKIEEDKKYERRKKE